MSSHRVATRLGAIALSALLFGGCVADSGGGPFHRPDVSADRIVGAAIPALTAGGGFGAAGAVMVLDRLDPSTILRQDRLPVVIREAIASWGDEPPSDALSESIKSALEGALEGRLEMYLPYDPAPYAPGDARCSSPFNGGTFVRLAMLPGLAVHGDVYLVVVQAGDGCGRVRWTAARLIWQPGGLIGGEWVPGEIMAGGD